ncbi:MAG: hypothetical protein KC731_42355, partial [Myxococcales bacterium]|nr:hypothetical protein [Myxococcales bacterium]
MATAEPTFVAILAMALAACGGTAVIDGGDGSGGSGASGAGGDGSGAGGMGTGGSGTGGAHLTAAIVDATFIADCMPVVPPDPLRGEVFIEWSSDMPGQPG